MGDRTYLGLSILESDLPKLYEALECDEDTLYAEEDVRESGVVNLFFTYCNYGWYEERQGLAKLGAVFCGYHGSGGEYDGYVFCGIEGKAYDAPCLDGTGPVAVVMDDGQPNQRDLEIARAYLEAMRKVNAIFEAERGRHEQGS